MKNICKRSFIGALLLAFVSTTLPLHAKTVKTEDQLIADLSSPKDGDVTAALQKLEKEYPTSTDDLPAIKKLLADPREAVRRKAARVLGSLHADVDSTDLNNICQLLKAPDKREIMDGLIALRGLKAQRAVPQILPLLKSNDTNVLRDSCRTLAVLGDKSNVSDIQPLLTFPDPKVQKDAMDAIALLKAKS
jgi:HEAT repeat protein